MAEKRKVLVFDSGVGGISVINEMYKNYPDLDITFLSDDVMFPYGTKQDGDLLQRVPNLLKAFLSLNTYEVVVIACNTASTVCLSAIRDVLNIPVVGVVPAIKTANEYSHSRTFGVLATPATIGRKYTHDLIKRFAKDCQVFLQGSSHLVTQAENKLAGKEVDQGIIAYEVMQLIDKDLEKKMDTIVLGCTHFPLLRTEISVVTNQHAIGLVDSGEAIARRVASILKIPPKPTLANPQYKRLLASSLKK